MSQEKTQVNDVCRISKGTVVKVKSWVSDADMRIDGQFYGNINTSGRVVIGEKGLLVGDVQCSSLDIWGTFKGNVLCNGVTTIRGIGSFSGVTNTVRICIEVGALLEGTCKVITEEEFAKSASKWNPAQL